MRPTQRRLYALRQAVSRGASRFELEIEIDKLITLDSPDESLSELAEWEAGLPQAARQLRAALDTLLVQTQGTQQYRISKEAHRAAISLLSRLALGPLTEAPIDELLSVALDFAEEQGECSEGLREQVARHLGALKLCTPWNTEATYGRTIRSASTGEELILTMESHDEGETEPPSYSVHIDGRTSWVQSWERVEEIAAEWLKREGWARVPGPKEAP